MIIRRIIAILFAVTVLFSTPAHAEKREVLLKQIALNMAHREMFATSSFAALDQGMNAVQRGYETGLWSDALLWSLFGWPFAGRDDALKEIYDAWVSAYPKSYAARVARASYYIDHASFNWGKPVQKDAEGKETGAEIAIKYAEVAFKDCTAALKLSSKPIHAYARLMVLHALSGDMEKSREILLQANAAVPLNILARHQYILLIAENDKVDASTRLNEMRKFMRETRKENLPPQHVIAVSNVYHGQLLEQSQYALLDEEMNAIQADYEAGKMNDRLLDSFFAVFDMSTDPTLEEKYGAWIAEFPKSYAARQARARYLSGLGWEARGEKLIKDTTGKEVSGMELYMRRAMQDALAAIPLASKPILSYKTVYRISMAFGDHDMRKKAVQYGKTIDPRNTVVRYANMFGLQTKWGGSLKEMEECLAEAKAAGIVDETIILMEDLLLQEKLYLANEMKDEYSKIGQIVTGF